MEHLRVLIADGSPVYKRMFTQAVTEVSKNASTICASDSDGALGLIKRHNYDIIIVDAEIPGPGLIELLKKIARDIPKAFILVTARPSSADGDLFLDAMSNGAAECMTKPIYDSYGENLDIIERKMADIIAALLGERDRKTGKHEIDTFKVKKTLKKSKFHPEIILIAASTGGPAALEIIIPKIRWDIPVPILAVQHISQPFTETLAHHLNQKSQLVVKVAENKETISAGTVYFAPGGVHMRLDAKNNIYLNDDLPVNGVRPAADVLFSSVAESSNISRVLTVILTGMGTDGKGGVVSLKEKKDCFCLAQSERTCVVYGMPRAVAEDGLADKIMDLDKIPLELDSFEYV